MTWLVLSSVISCISFLVRFFLLKRVNMGGFWRPLPLIICNHNCCRWLLLKINSTRYVKNLLPVSQDCFSSLVKIFLIRSSKYLMCRLKQSWGFLGQVSRVNISVIWSCPNIISGMVGRRNNELSSTFRSILSYLAPKASHTRIHLLFI